MNDVPAFRDADAAPTEELLAAVVGPSLARWHRLVAAAESMGARGEWTWNGPKYGWGWRMKRAGKPFLSLDAGPGSFRALVILGREHSAEAASLPLGPAMRATYEAARQYPDGRWLFHAVETDEDVEDVLMLLRLKLPPTVRARLEAERPATTAGSGG